MKKTTYQAAIELSERADRAAEIDAFIRHVLHYRFGTADFNRAAAAFRRGRNAVERELAPILKDDEQ